LIRWSHLGASNKIFAEPARKGGKPTGRAFVMQLSQGEMSGFKGAAVQLSAVPRARELLACSGYNGDWFRKGAGQRVSHDPHDAVSASSAKKSITCSAG
jgi:hypothetical protein